MVAPSALSSPGRSARPCAAPAFATWRAIARSAGRPGRLWRVACPSVNIRTRRSPGLARRSVPLLAGYDGHPASGPAALELAESGAGPSHPTAAGAGLLCYFRAASTPAEQSVLTLPECAYRQASTAWDPASTSEQISSMSAEHAAGTAGGVPDPIRFLTEAGNSRLLWLCLATASTSDVQAASSFEEWLKRHAEIRPRPLGTPEHRLAMSTWHADIRSARAAPGDDAARTVAIAIREKRVWKLNFMVLLSTLRKRRRVSRRVGLRTPTAVHLQPGVRLTTSISLGCQDLSKNAGIGL